MDWPTCSTELLDLIERELAIAHDLGLALAQERDALRSFDPVALDTATTKKQLCVERLSELDTERQAMCVSVGMSSDRDGMEQLLMQADPKGELSQRWQTLLTRIESCREANFKNGTVVRLQKRRVTEALGILHGEAANNAVYGDNGEMDDTSGNHVHTEI